MSNYFIEKANRIYKEQGIEFFLQHKLGTGDVVYAHIHPAVELLYIITGSFSITADERQSNAHPGDLVVFRANTVHTIILNEADCGEYYVLKIPPEMILRIFAGTSQLKYSMPFLKRNRLGNFLYSGSAMPSEISEIWNKMIAEYMRSDETFFISERIYASALMLAMTKSLPDFEPISSVNDGITSYTLPLIFEILSYINENFASELSAEFCAEYIHISYSYFARLFRSVTGKTFKEYLTSVRLAKAQELLGGTGMPITDIALACGYNSLSYFISEYKKAFGKTPGGTRKKPVE